jgi:threonine synthase
LEVTNLSYSYLDHLECGRCGLEYEAGVPQGLCRCGAPLLARYDLSAVAAKVGPGTIADRPAGLWRYHELLPVARAESVVSLGETMTPLLAMPELGRQLGLRRLFMKDEGLLPTGSFKARGAAVGVSRASELGVRRIAMPTNGNAGAAWAIYAARAGMEALIAMPADAPAIARAECQISGARLYLVDGLINDAGAMIARAVAEQGYFDSSTLKEPYRLEGKKTMGLELFEQLGWRVPDVILYPTGGGVGLIGIHKALQECRELGWIGDKLPRLVSVQASGCAPIVRAWENGDEVSQAWEKAATVAFGINVPKALGDFMILKALRETQGCAVAVQASEILSAQARVGGAEGAFICPEGAACFAAAEHLRRQGWIEEEEEVVVLNTGTGLKYPDTVAVAAPTLARGESIPPA